MKIARVLFATTNPTKAARMKELVSHLPLEVISLEEMNRDSQVAEDGNTPAENACKKAEYHYMEMRMPTVAIDSGLYIERLSENQQPGLMVRRICGTGKQITDEEMLRYYRQELDKVGGKSRGEWVTAIALKTSLDNIFYETFSSETMFSSQASDVLMPGETLNSLQLDPIVGKYYSEMTPEERKKAQGRRAAGIIDFMERYLHILL